MTMENPKIKELRIIFGRIRVIAYSLAYILWWSSVIDPSSITPPPPLSYSPKEQSRSITESQLKVTYSIEERKSIGRSATEVGDVGQNQWEELEGNKETKKKWGEQKKHNSKTKERETKSNKKKRPKQNKEKEKTRQWDTLFTRTHRRDVCVCLFCRLQKSGCFCGWMFSLFYILWRVTFYTDGCFKRKGTGIKRK